VTEAAVEAMTAPAEFLKLHSTSDTSKH